MTQMPRQQPLLLQLHMDVRFHPLALAAHLQATPSKLRLFLSYLFLKNMHQSGSGIMSFYLRLQKCAAVELEPAAFVLNCLIFSI